MASDDTGVGGLAGRYALALFELADANQQLDSVATEVGQLQVMLSESEDLRRLITSPVIARDTQAAAIGAVLQKAGVSDLTGRFVQVVAHNRRLFALPEMIRGYLAELRRHRGEVTAQVTSAHDLTESQRSALTDALRNVVGAKVQVDLSIDPALLGGLVVRVGSRMIDSSLRTKLQKLQFAMKGIG